MAEGNYVEPLALKGVTDDLKDARVIFDNSDVRTHIFPQPMSLALNEQSQCSPGA
jgi:hypothetical protein